MGFNEIDRIFQAATKSGRRQLFEYEIYSLLQAVGAESAPTTRFWSPDARLTNKEIQAFPGQQVVLKIVSLNIVHKSDVGGVQIVEKKPGKVRSGCRRMLDEVVEHYSAFLESRPDQFPRIYQGLCHQALREAVARDIQGVLICEYLPPDSLAFGNELLVSLRLTREFGMVITAGLGGADTELFAESFRRGQAVVSASVEQFTGAEFLSLFKSAIAYKKLGGLTRGGKRLVSDRQLLDCLSSFIELGRRYSPLNSSAAYVIDELEINPFAFSDYQITPLDGLCRFSPLSPVSPARDLTRIDRLLHARTVAVMGVSSNKVNFGRQILRNILGAGYPAERVQVINPSASEIDGVVSRPDLKSMGQVDLLVVAVAAAQAPDIIDELVEYDLAKSVVLIPGGMGETEESRQRAREVIAKISNAHTRPGGGPVFLGGNCMGFISHPAKINTFFASEISLPKDHGDRPRNVALICQSGAFALTRAMKLVNGDPLYNITVGNQMDLTIGDFVNRLAEDNRVEVFGIYAEGFKPLDGLHLAKGIQAAVLAGKEIIVYKAGRTPEGKLATSGHTASVAGDYAVCVACLEQAGALVAQTFSEFDGLLNLASVMHSKKVNGNRVAGLSSAGFEAVGMADCLQAENSSLRLARFGDHTMRALRDLLAQHHLECTVDVKNPLDLTPAANDLLHTAVIRVMADDDGVDSLVVSYDTICPFTGDIPQPDTLPGYEAGSDSFGSNLIRLAAAIHKPIVVFNDVGRIYEPLNARLESAGVPVYKTAGEAMSILARYTSYRLALTVPHRPDSVRGSDF
ncbi:MAG: acetate--CoA ligase family protein [Pseudomonadota bacterium]